MAISFDDEHLNSQDPRKNSDTTKYNGGIAGTAKKWDSYHSNNPGTKNGLYKASRSIGTGQAGVDAMQPGEVTDTSKMSPEEKFRYMQALGLLGDKPVQEPVQQTPAKPVMQRNQPFRRGR